MNALLSSVSEIQFVAPVKSRWYRRAQSTERYAFDQRAGDVSTDGLDKWDTLDMPHCSKRHILGVTQTRTANTSRAHLSEKTRPLAQTASPVAKVLIQLRTHPPYTHLTAS